MNLSGMDWKAVVDDLYKSTNMALKRRDKLQIGTTEYERYQLEASITLNIAQALEFGRKQ